jgi:asparagine synthetase B (glutamine-hydrolysing)
MTLIAGIVNRGPDQPVPAAACETLRRLISRSPADNALTSEGPGYFFAKLDIGAFGQPAAVNVEDDRLTFVTGEPLLGVEGSNSRQSDTEQIHGAFKAGNEATVFRQAAGVFSAVHYDRSQNELTLVTDKLGIRPVYYWAGSEYVVFASALRILEELELVPKVMEVRTVTEIVGLGYALADRTPYADIRMLRAAGILCFNGPEMSQRTYWHWDRIEQSPSAESGLLAEIFQRFDTAVERRNGSDTATSAYLSGGLDSRCIVGALCGRGVEVHTYNFARPQTQDLIFGREFAQQVGAKHTEEPKESGDMVPDFSQLMADAISTSDNSESISERPGLVWSGEGGSVALGHVHLTEEMVGWMRNGQVDRVIDEYIKRESAAVAPRLFNAVVSSALEGILEKGIKSELARLNASDPARNFYLFLLLNDQHRKLARHFETIDLHRLELQLPFFDSHFIEGILTVPLDLCLRHSLYAKWLSLFPPTVTAVPWQTYPGHEPCPVPISAQLAYQWADEYQFAERATQRRKETRQASRMLRSKDFPDEILNRRNLRLAALIHQTGFRNYQYLLGPARVYYEYWQKCGGRFVMPNQNGEEKTES